MLTLLSLLLVASPSPAPAPVAPEASHLEAFYFFVGDWTCSGDIAPEWSWTISKPVNGQLVGNSVTEAHGNELKVFRDTWSFSKADNHLLRVVVYHAASGVEALTTDGWQGDSLVFVGDLRQAERRVKMRAIFKRWSDDYFTLVRELERPDGSFKAEGTANCKRH